MTGPIAVLVERDFALSVGFAWDHGPPTPLADQRPQRVGVVSFVAQYVARAVEPSEQFGRRGDVVNVAGREQEPKRAADHIGQGMDFRGVSAAREADLLCFGPPFPPNAERCAFT